MVNSAFFLDRDGVINHDGGYIHQIEEFEFLPGVFGACRRIREEGFKLVIITNQAGIARGYYDEIQFNRLTDWMLTQFSEQGIHIDAVYYCPHHPVSGLAKYKQDCVCRKPKPGMILQAQQEHDFNLSRSYLVGDKVCDVMAGEAAGLKQSFLIHGNYDDQPTDYSRYDDLAHVVRSLFSD